MQKITSKNTAITGKASPAIKWLLKERYIKGTVLDYGAGKGRNARFLRNEEFMVYAFDPYNGEQGKNPWFHVGKNITDINHKMFDTVICSYVLNVVDKDIEKEIIQDVKRFLTRKGVAFFVVRNKDLLKLGTEEQLRKGVKTSRGFQRLCDLPMQCIKKTSGYKIFMYDNDFE